MAFIFPRNYSVWWTLLSWRWLSICLMMGSSEWISNPAGLTQTSKPPNPGARAGAPRSLWIQLHHQPSPVKQHEERLLSSVLETFHWLSETCGTSLVALQHVACVLHDGEMTVPYQGAVTSILPTTRGWVMVGRPLRRHVGFSENLLIIKSHHIPVKDFAG